MLATNGNELKNSNTSYYFLFLEDSFLITLKKTQNIRVKFLLHSVSFFFLPHAEEKSEEGSGGGASLSLHGKCS